MEITEKIEKHFSCFIIFHPVLNGKFQKKLVYGVKETAYVL